MENWLKAKVQNMLLKSRSRVERRRVLVIVYNITWWQYSGSSSRRQMVLIYLTIYRFLQKIFKFLVYFKYRSNALWRKKAAGRFLDISAIAVLPTLFIYLDLDHFFSFFILILYHRSKVAVPQGCYSASYFVCGWCFVFFFLSLFYGMLGVLGRWRLSESTKSTWKCFLKFF